MNKITEFQLNKGLVADGIIGKKTFYALKSYLKLSTDNRLVNILAQGHHETGGFSCSIENLNYSKEGLEKTFGKYFNYSNVDLYAHNPEKIANKVYSNRMGNGDEQSGDGWKYRGRGMFQLTGKNNYLAFSDYIGKSDVLDTPDLVASVYFFETALFYLERNKLLDLCDSTSTSSVTKLRKAINLGNRNSKSIPNGLKEVIELTKRYDSIIR